jgi:hypothetical protein
MIVDYPASTALIGELRQCIRVGNTRQLRARLMRSARADVQRRLLHPGLTSFSMFVLNFVFLTATNTTQILLMYTNAVSALRLLDVTGVIMNEVCQPIRVYIRCVQFLRFFLRKYIDAPVLAETVFFFCRDRPDSVRCIVSLLTERGHLDMYTYQRRNNAKGTFVSEHF